MFPFVLIPVSEYGFRVARLFGQAADASGSPRQNAWPNGTAKDEVGSSHREQRVGARVTQHVPVLV